ncbi:UNVERIFIED_CONTAM: hypothetical protein GTU68_020712 [Idotea baltica]|nr:hypothetical protein [Idotea baltica]
MNDKVVWITGASSGIGAALAREYHSKGASVILSARRKEKLEELSDEWKSMGYEAQFISVDIRKLSEVELAANESFEALGGIDILINNAGITKDASLKKMTSDQWQAVIDVNLTGVFNCTKAVTPYMKEAGAGRIVNASSVVGIYGNFGQSNYVASKAGVIGMTKTWAKELGRYGITVNAVAPGFIKTEMIDSVPQNVIDGMMAKSPLNRLGEVRDIANAYLYLSSDMGAYVTGTTLSVDGGLVI